MAEREINLKRSWESRRTDAKTKALDIIKLMEAEKEPVNFNSVHTRSGLSKNYLYNEREIRSCIEGIRQKQAQWEQIRHEKYDKTSKSKDVIIETKNRRIAKLEEENRRLRSELEMLRGMLYDR